MKRPSFQFYPGDWLHDTGLRACFVPTQRHLVHEIDSYCILAVWIDVVGGIVHNVGVHIPTLRVDHVQRGSEQWIRLHEASQARSVVAGNEVVQPAFDIPFFAGEFVGLRRQEHVQKRTRGGYVVSVGLRHFGASYPYRRSLNYSWAAQA